jgi:phospholipid/cholesterol/gamma-HCH transport system substrate-binding protein
MAGVSTEAKVGIFVLMGIAILAYMTIRLGKFELGGPEGYQTWAVFDQATGLKKNAPVEMAGIQIGQVSDILLDNGKARVVMRVSQKVPLAADATAYIRTRGVLGDKYVAVEPGSPGAPKIKDGERLANAKVPTDLDQVMARIGEVADNIKDITAALKVSIGSPESTQNIRESLANLRQLTAALNKAVTGNEDRLNRIMANVDRFTGDLSQLSGENKKALTETISNFRLASAQMQTTVAALDSVVQKVDKGQGSIGALVNERKTVDDLNAVLASLRDVAQKIEQGKGTIGKLVNDDTTVTKIDEALTSINDYLARADAWKVYVTYRGDYMFKQASLRSELNVRLQPRADRFFLVGVVDDPRGRRSESDQTQTITRGGVTTVEHRNTVTYNRDDITWNLQFGKRFYDLTLRAGIFSSTGGLAADYYLFNDALKLTMEAYRFRTDARPNLRFAADYSFWRYFFVTAGVDDILSQDGDTTFFLGGGILFIDDDLKFLLTKAPVSP